MMKTQRITVLTSPKFKAFLAGEAQAEGVSISELVRRRCEQRTGKDEELLGTLARQLRLSNAVAHAALDQALAAIDTAQTEMKKMQTLRHETDKTQ